MKKPNFSVRFPEELVDALRSIAKEEGVSVGALVREASHALVLSRMLNVR